MTGVAGVVGVVGQAPSQATPKTFITSSPRWLITFTAMSPVFGLSNGRETSLFSVAQASASTACKASAQRLTKRPPCAMAQLPFASRILAASRLVL